MLPKKLSSKIEYIPLVQIEPNPDNPRGTFEKDSSFSRLVQSIDKVGILVPLVIIKLRPHTADARYRLLDGERRYWAARELALGEVPANVIHEHVTPGELRKLMFHIHMTREQWGPLAQCRALTEAYKPLSDGLPFSEKPSWEKQISRELNISKRTARDRIHFLAWPRILKDEVFDFNLREPKKDIYSYVLAIEASIVVPSLSAFPEFYNHNQPPEKFANEVRGGLLEKTTFGLETGQLVNREQIRDVEPLFVRVLPTKQHQTAGSIFKKLVSQRNYLYQDARAEIETRLPGVLREKPPKPGRLIANIRSLTRTLELYRPEYLEDVPRREKLKKEIKEALAALEAAIKSVRANIQ